MSGALDAAKGAFKASRQVINNPGIAQDNVIFAMLLFAFVVWITTKGELGTYLALFKPGSNVATNALGIDTPVTASSTNGNAQGGVSGAVSTAVNSTGLGSAITKLTGVAPLSIGITPGSIASTIQGWFK
jgi:hypothetical protein